MIRRQYSKLSISLAVCILFAIITLASWYNHLQSRFYRRVELKINWAIFSEDTDCEQWLKQVSDTITYPYKPTAPDSSALKLRDCVLSDKAVRMRDRIQRIAVAFPVSGESTSLQQPLLDIIESLPNRKPEVIWPCNTVDRGANWAYSDWASSQTPQRYAPFCYPEAEERDPPMIIDCSSKDIDVGIMGGSKGFQSTFDHLYKTLASCQNIESLTLFVADGGWNMDSSNRRAFNWSDGDIFPSLRNLTIINYDWRVSEDGQISDPWINRMDWSQLEHLEMDIPSPQVFESLMSKLSGLRSLKLHPEWGFWGDGGALCSYDSPAYKNSSSFYDSIISLSPLNRLSLNGLGGHLEITKLLEKHGPTLEQFTIHNLENDCQYITGNDSWVRPYLNLSEIAEIRERAPHLKSLGLDVHRTSSTWLGGVFKELSEFTDLEDLTMYFNNQDPYNWNETRYCPSHGSCLAKTAVEPPLTKSISLELWRKIEECRKSNGLSMVRTLTLYAGDWGETEMDVKQNTYHDENPIPKKYRCTGQPSGSVQCLREKGIWDYYNNDDTNAI